MQKTLFTLSIVSLTVALYAFRTPEPPTVTWYTFEEAVRLNREHPKKILIDIVTSWCPNCRKMEKKTFSDPRVIEYLNNNFYPVRFDAEQKETVQFKDHTLKFMPEVGSRGVHELAYALVDGNVIYPSLVYLDPDLDRIAIFQEFQNAEQFLSQMKFIREDQFKKMTFQEFSTQNHP